VVILIAPLPGQRISSPIANALFSAIGLQRIGQDKE
jgi:hypothetical protein